MSSENSTVTWEQLEAQLFGSGVQLLETAMQAARVRASLEGSELLGDLLRRADLAPRLVVTVSGENADMLTMAVLLHDRNTDEPVARLYEITARSEELPSCLH